MATSIDSITVMCSACNKAKGVYKCEGCLRNFCPTHSIDHRNELEKHFEKTESIHDLIHHTLIQQTDESRPHPLFKKIDQWEEQSLLKIRQKAEEIRNELLKNIKRHKNQVKQKFQHISIQLKQSREKNDFTEIELRTWTRKLNEFKKELLNPLNITIQNISTPLIPNIRLDLQDIAERFRIDHENGYEFIHTERDCQSRGFRFENRDPAVRMDYENPRSVSRLVHDNRLETFRLTRRYTLDVLDRVQNNIRIEDNGRLVVKDNSNNYSEIRGRKEYSFGKHLVRLTIDNLTGNSWIFFGIISKSETKKGCSFKLPSSYGWTTANQIYEGGINIGGSTIEIIQNDTITLSIDCDKRKIQLKNERTNRTTEMLVDINKCSFPWQIHFNLHAPNTRLRILPPSD